uniref:Platelet-derived growth factor (PDGF) family profile domain-containing protein n=1 Tax=Daphnia galeata TaxID=27404 RepID=A0A8J2WES0_9CRUS|nr:unnamed protein product [Daphnia galeata]
MLVNDNDLDLLINMFTLKTGEFNQSVAKMRRESNRRNGWPIIWLLIVVRLLSFVESDDDNVKHVPFLANLKAAIRCGCKYPQPRLIHIDDLEEYRIPNAIYVPSALVIHRCGRSIGYCHAPAHVCASVVSREEDVTFHVKNLFFTPSNALRPMTSITLRNHTACKCVSSSRLAYPHKQNQLIS